MTPVIDPIIYFTLLLMVLTLTFIKYAIKIMPDLGVWKLNYFIPPNNAKLMGGHQSTREVNISQSLSIFQINISSSCTTC